MNPDTLADAAQATRLSDQEWVELHVPRFEKVQPAYEIFSDFLRKVLLQACRRLAPTTVVEVRTKKLPSFAEKILRKRSLYQDPHDPLPPDPLVRMTDLCGGRVVTQTADEVKDICRFIETAFEIDWANSEDLSQRLKPTEFGYRSVHYIVQIDEKKLQEAGINLAVPTELRGFTPKVLGENAAGRPLKAEVQVRTLLEHAAASLGHDTLYKTELKVPGRLKRDHAILAAMLENVDSGFGLLLASLKEFRSNFGAYRDRAAAEKEIALLRIVLQCDVANTALAVRIATHALAIGGHELAVQVLEPYVSQSHPGVQRLLGQALTEMHRDTPQSTEFRRGRAFLEAACADPPKDAETLCLLADSIARDDDHQARELFHEAIQADPTEPVTLARYLEFETAHLQNENAVRLSTPMIRNAMARCRKQIDAGVNLPAAWSSLGLFCLLLQEPFDAINAIAQCGTLCQGHGDHPPQGAAPARPCAAGRALKRLRETLRRLRTMREKLPGFDWCEQVVLLLLAVRVADRNAREELQRRVSWKDVPPHFAKSDCITILAGGCVPELEAQLDLLKGPLLRGCAGLSFKLLCGGTRVGISRLAGDLAEASRGAIQAFGYLPKSLPLGVKEDEDRKRYVRLFSSEGTDFTPLEPLQAWIDLAIAGIDSRKVKALAYAGGKITRAECAVALALGARVGIIENPSLPRDRQFLDPTWQEHPNLVRLPIDAMTIRAFLLVDDIPISAADRKRLEKAARNAHEDYVRSAAPRDPSLQKWDELNEELKLSNFHQVAYWAQMLRERGLGLRELTQEDEQRPLLKMEEVIGEEGIRELAEMEHGRWNVERLLRGWRHAESKDIAKKLNPCLVSWPALKDINGQDFQPYDLNAIRAMPQNFRVVGLEMVKL